MRLRQVVLQQPTKNGQRQIVAWVCADWKIKRGSSVVGEDDGEKWTVVEAYDTCIDTTKINRRWSWWAD